MSGGGRDVYELTIRSDERLNGYDRAWVAHEGTERESWAAHVNVHALEAQALVLQHGDDERRLHLAETRIEALEGWRNRAAGVALVLTLFAGTIGFAVAKALGK